MRSANSRLYLTVGLFVLVGIAALLYLALRIGGGMTVGRDTYQLRARFSDVGGLKSGSAVTLSGVSIGQVGEITLDPQDFSAIAEIFIPNDVQLDDDTIASVRSRGLLGDQYISIAPGGSGVRLKAGDLIIDTEPSVSMTDLIGRLAFGALEDGDGEDEDGDFDFGLDLSDPAPTEADE